MKRMKSINEIKQALKEMETRRTAACLDMCEVQPNGIKYDTEIIRRIESIDVTIHVLKWVLEPSNLQYPHSKTKTGYPSWQKGGDYEIVTDWFWSKYKERGIISIPEIWHRTIPADLTHKEHHTF